MIDEAHHAPAETYQRIIDQARELNLDAMILGLTATPRRSDKKALRRIFDNVADQVLVGELIQSGHLAKRFNRQLIERALALLEEENAA